MDLRHAFACLTPLLALAVAGWGAVQNAEKASEAPGQGAEIRDLSRAETIPFPTPPPTVLLTETKCDVSGNIYVVQSAAPPSILGSGGLSSLPVLKLSIGSKSTMEYPVPTLDGYRGVIRSDFDVSADGKLYSLLQALDASSTESKVPPSSFIARYRDDGGLDSYVKLADAAKGRIQPFRLAVFRNGNVLVTGTVVNEGEPLRPFIAVFDRAGQFLTYVKVSDTAHAPPAASDGRSGKTRRQTRPQNPAETKESESGLAIDLSSSSFMVSGPDGNVYLLRDAAHPRLYAVSSAGEVVQEVEIPLPAPGLTASNMAIAGNNDIFISFGHVQGVSSSAASTDGPNQFISVIDNQTGDVSAVYHLPADADGFSTPACAISADNFLFLAASADQKQQQVVRYTVR